MPEIYHSPYTSHLAETKPGRARRWGWGLCIGAATLILIGWWGTSYLNTPPANFAAPTEVEIKPGSGVATIAKQLAAAEVVRSARWFSLQTALFYDPASFQAGTYEFTNPQPVAGVIDKLQRGEVLPQDQSVTLVEGRTRTDYADTLAEALPHFSRAEFLRLTTDHEGYLFPDTYRFAPSATATTVVQALIGTFASRTEPLAEAVAEHPLAEEELVNLASILEREANSATSMRMVSGILQNRLEIGMALQADATIGYVLDKPLSDITPSDLERESPYNTYLHTGLPPTPISNPGLTALRAALEPASSEYLYYITGIDGNFYYAETYAEHQRNIARYLR